MTPLHPSHVGSPIRVWFVDGDPVRLLSESAPFRVLAAKCADINGLRYWRLRTRGADGQTATFTLRQSDDGGWVLSDVGDEPPSLDAS
ncbi:MAG: hypothetical protein WBL06_12635 [Pseudolysinimonas sp.]|jgi:hypothetical protein|uniref:hypothetical protein n=1 Tax=Pseudolysinimonas sp. TaxID=2680009 RepID=UPI003C71CF96